jgi:hypothetical protein
MTTNATQWQWPEDLPKPEIDVDDIRSAKDPTTGNVYYAEGDTTSWDVPDAVVAAHVDSLLAEKDSVTSPAPVADDTPTPKEPASDAVAAASTAAPEAKPDAPAAKAAVASESKHPFGFSDAVFESWLTAIRTAKEEAELAISTRDAKFQRLRQFKRKQAQRRKAEAERKKEEAAQRAKDEEVERAMEEAERQKTLMQLIEVEIPPAPEEKKNLEDYAASYLQLNRKGIFKSATTVEKLLTFKQSLISMSLHDFGAASADLNASATQMWKNILAFIGERSSGKGEGGHAEKIIKTALNAPEELRDEVYVQLIKAATGNPSAESTLRAWALMGCVSGAFAPSETLRPYFESFCYSAVAANPASSDAAEPGVHEYAKYVIGRIEKVSKLGPRREIPTSAEIAACSSLLPVIIRVEFLDGSFEYTAATSWSTPSDLKEQICDLLGIAEPNRECFAIYELTPDMEERHLEPDERILDLISYWQRLHEETEKKKKESGDSRFYRLVFKVHLYHDVMPDPESGKADEASERLMWIQACFDVVTSRYPAGEEHCLELAALNRQAETPGEPPTEAILSRYIPGKLAFGTRKKEMLVEIGERMKKHSGLTPLEARAEVMTMVRKWKVYGSSFFFVSPHMSSTLPEEVFLAVNPQGVLIIDPTSKKVLSQYAYSEIPTWGHSGSSFVLHVGNLLRQTKLYFSTEMGAEINQLVRAYIARSISTAAAKP